MNHHGHTQQLLNHGLGSLKDAQKGIAYEGLSAFRTADYDTAQRKFSEIIDSDSDSTPSHLHTSLILAECFLAMLQPDQALKVLEPCWNRKSPFSVTFSHPLWGKISKIFATANDLCQVISDIEQLQSHEQWNDVLQKMFNVQGKRNHDFQMAGVALPAIWSYWKTEAHLQLGNLNEAESEIGAALLVSSNPKVPHISDEDRLWIAGLMAYVKQDLDVAFEKLNSALLLNAGIVKIRKLFDIIKAKREASLQELNHYELLQITPDATDLEIRTAFRHQALNAHPDRRSDGSHLEMVHLTLARDILLDTKQRQKYDLQLASKKRRK